VAGVLHEDCAVEVCVRGGGLLVSGL
jgi:hypothetical protein